jgi:hypothetical protein
MVGRQLEAEINKQQQTEQELKRLHVEKCQCVQRAKQLSKEQDKTWKQEILILAQIIEKEYVLLGQEWLITDISEEITRIFRENEIRIAPWVHDLIPSRYKNGTEQSSIQLRDQPRDLPEQSFISDLKGFIPNVEIVPTNQISEGYYLIKTLEQQFEKRAALEKIALLRSDNSSPMDYNNDSQSGNKEPTKTDFPRPHGSLLYDELELVINDLTNVRKRVFQFPPEILEMDNELAEAWRSFRAWMRPALDLKYSQSTMEWLNTEKYRDIYGKHAASVLSFSVTNLCANCSDEKHNEWVRMEPVFENTYQTYDCLQCHYSIDTVCPKCNISMKQQNKTAVSWQCSNCDGTVPINRDLTREQVGDKSSIVVDSALDIIKNIPVLVGFCKWHKDWINPRVGGRKERLGPDLSDKA